jgi:hypothetical protein
VLPTPQTFNFSFRARLSLFEVLGGTLTANTTGAKASPTRMPPSWSVVGVLYVTAVILVGQSGVWAQGPLVACSSSTLTASGV